MTQRILGVVLAFAATSRAQNQDPPKKLDPERVRTLLIADAERQSKVSVALEFRQKVVYLTTRTGQKQKRAIHVKLNGPLAKGSCYQHVTGAKQPRVQIEHGDQRYGATPTKDGTWASYKGPRKRMYSDGLVAPLRYPAPQLQTLGEFLRKNPILEASMQGDKLTVFVPLDKIIAELMRQRKLNGFAGIVGWRCVLQKSGKRFRLLRIEHIVTTYRLVADRINGGAKREPHKRFLTKQGRRRIIGSNEFGVLRYTEFSRFKATDGFDLPMKVVHEVRQNVMTAEIDPASLKQNVVFADSDFAFRPPR